MTAALAASGCGAHASPMSRAFWNQAGENTSQSTYEDLQLVKVDMPLVSYTLNNGLKVIQHEDHRAPFVTLLIEYDVGAFDDPEGSAGLAHLTEHLLFRGSRNVNDGAFARTLEQSGGTRINAYTRDEATRYMETLPSNQLELALWMESDRLAFPFEQLDEAKFATEKEVVKNELRDIQNRPYSAVFERIRRALYPAGHPYYELPTVGEALAELDSIQLEDARRFFREHYGPNRATMVLAGDIASAKVKAMVTKYFAALPLGAPAAPKRSPRVVVRDHPTTLRIEADVAGPALVVCWPSVPEFSPDDAELDVLATLLTHGSGQLGWKLMGESKIASNIAAHQVSRRFGSYFAIEATLNSADDFIRALDKIDDTLARLAAAPPSLLLTRASKFRWSMTLLFRYDSLSGRSAGFLDYARQASDPGYLPQDLARYAAVDPRGIQRVARLLRPDNRVIAMVVPKAGAPVSGAEEP
jgi:zinc protease